MAFRHKYGVLGAGAVSSSLIGRLPSKARDIGPVCAVSYRVASRIANAIRAGSASRSLDELNKVPVVLFHAPNDQAIQILQLLEQAQIDWRGKSLIFCDCRVDEDTRNRFEMRGASVAVLRDFGVPGRMLTEVTKGRGGLKAIRAARGLVHQLAVKAVEVSPEAASVVDAAVTLATGVTTVLIDRAAALFRETGVRDQEAARFASTLFEQTAQGYAHSGRQSWVWHMREPDVLRLRRQLAAFGPDVAPIFRDLLLTGFERFQKHPDVAKKITAE